MHKIKVLVHRELVQQKSIGLLPPGVHKSLQGFKFNGIKKNQENNYIK